MKELMIFVNDKKEVIRFDFEEYRTTANSNLSELEIRRILKKMENKGSIRILKQK